MKKLILMLSISYVNSVFSCPIYSLENLKCSETVDDVVLSFIMEKQEVFKNRDTDEYKDTFTVSTTLYGHISNLTVPSTKKSGEVLINYTCEENSVVTQQEVNDLKTISKTTLLENGFHILGENIVTVKTCKTLDDCEINYEVYSSDMKCLIK